MGKKEPIKKSEGHKAHSSTQQGSVSSSEFLKVFTTKPALRRLTWHKLSTVRKRIFALQESFYPTTDVPYEAVRTRMATLLGICDSGSVLAYLGRPEHAVDAVIQQRSFYKKTGTVVPKTITRTRMLSAKKGYIQIFDAGYLYVKPNKLNHVKKKRFNPSSEWWIHWNHTFQPTLPECENLPEKSPRSPTKESANESSKCSIEDFSLPNSVSNGLTVSPRESVESKGEHVRDVGDVGDRVEREERVVLCRERNCESKSIHSFHGKDHEPKVKVFNESPRAKPTRRTAKDKEGYG